MAKQNTITARDGTGHVMLGGRQILMLASNDYLGLSTDRRVIAAITASCARYGTGMTIYPIFVISDEHSTLEQELARFLGVEDVLLTVSGGAANAVALTGLVGEGDFIISDADNHASTIDAGRLSRAQVKPYKTRDMASARDVLASHAGQGRCLLVSNGVFSMDGGIAPLRDLVDLCEHHQAILVVDDAHATGVVGKNGRGSLSASGLPAGLSNVFVTGSLSKALGGAGGGFLGGPRDAIAALRRNARSYVFTQGMTSAACAAALAALRRLKGDPSLHQQLWHNIETLQKAARKHGLTLLPSESAIQTVLVGSEERAIATQHRLLEQGLFVQAMTFPIVPHGGARLRLQASAAHIPETLEDAIATIAQELCA
ncbi:aminotransferase class I/II-fold pyridoxal phosphate-dependent enzyme [Thalassospira marina]|uniref:Aminotransferase class I/classII large domain-containing protein n=1 Tax=Thalassospira marina TaxID=2048283 RepID=A0A2N3KC60_9PROT|nr:aminotransferase class I/II-fold pyridoxal phosphate-dependent enzyme [Thalassospira marina]PKR48043.1 hypothetical protein COO20_25165 [Thalassospira marina]